MALNNRVALRRPLADELAALLIRALRLDKVFPNFTKKDLEEALTESALYNYPQGAEVVRQASEGRDLFVIVTGGASVYRLAGGERRRVATLRAGDLFGEVGLMREDAMRTASVITDEPSSIFRLPYTDMFYHLDRNPELGEHLQAIANQHVKGNPQ